MIAVAVAVNIALAVYTLYVVGCAYEHWAALGRPELEEL